MLLVALGYNAEVQGYVGNDWALNVTRDAQKSGLFKDLKNLASNKALNRDEAAQMIYNAAIEANTILARPEWDSQAGKTAYTYIEQNGTHLLGKTFDGAKKVGYLEDVTYNTTKKLYTYTFDDGSANRFGSAGALTGSDVITDGETLDSAVDYSELYGRKVEVVYNTEDDTIYGIYAHDDSSVVFEGVIGNLPSALLTGDTDMKISGTTYKFNSNAGAVTAYSFLNPGSTYSGAHNLRGEASLSLATGMKLIDNNGDEKIDTAVINPFKVAKITYVGSTTFNYSDADVANKSGAGSSVELGTGSITKDTVNVYDGIAKDDYALVTAAVNTADGKQTFTKLETVQGKITSFKSGEFQLDGTAYKDESATITSGNLDDTFKIAVYNGYAVAQKQVAVGAALEEYAVVIAAQKKDNDAIGGNQVKLLFADGTTKTVPSSANYLDGTAMTGELVTYKIESGKYTLTKADDLTGKPTKTSGHDVVVETNHDTYEYGTGTINNAKIADDAVVFKYNGTDYEVISGAQLKRISEDNGSGVSMVNNAFGNTDASTGYTTVRLAYVTTAGTVQIKTSDYAYITSDVNTVLNSKSETTFKFTMWTKDGEVADVVTDHDSVTSANGNIAKASIIRYTKNDDGTYSVEAALDMNRAAVVAYDAKAKTVRVTDGTLDAANGTNVNVKIDEDTAIIGIDTDAKKGVEGAEIALAVETSTDDVYQANAYWFSSTSAGDGTDVLDVIFVDTYAKAPQLPGTIALTNSASAADYLAAVSSYKYVTVDTTSDETIPAALTVPAGTTVTFSSDGTVTVDTSKNLTVEGTVVFNGAVTLTGNVDVQSTGTVTFNGTVSDGSKILSSDSAYGATVKFGASANVTTTTGFYEGDNDPVDDGTDDLQGFTFRYVTDVDGAGADGWMKQ